MPNLYQQLTRMVDPVAPFAIMPDGGRMTYADMDAASARYANLLRRLGIRSGDRVAVQAEKSIHMLMLYLGCVRAGGVFLPLNPAYTAAEVAYFVEDAQPVLLICDPSREGEFGTAAASAMVRTLDGAGGGSLGNAVASVGTSFDTVERADDDLAAILYTSGTTGRSKGAMLTHRNLASNALTLKDLWRFTAADVLLHALPIFHTHGLFVATNTVLAAGAAMNFLQRFDVDAVLAAMPHSTVMMGVPTFYIRLLGDPRFDRSAAAGMRLFVSGSAPLSADVHRRFEERIGHAILERYGMTETNMNTSNPYDGERRAGTVGFALPGVDIRITEEESGERVDEGDVGVIEIAGPNVFAGYWRLPEKTAAEFNGGFFRSGDLGRFDADGYLSIVGRAKDLIISGGHNVYPAEVEAVLDALPEVLESAVIGIPHPDLGEGVVAIVVPSVPGGDVGDIVVRMTEVLARYKQPRHVVAVDALPKNAMGKIQKTVLREQHSALFNFEPTSSR